jgi:uncharacterized protein YkwD
MLQRMLIIGGVLSLALACCGGEPEEVKLTAEEQRILDSTNELRKKEGLAPLRVNALLVEAARKHSQMMAKKDMLEHVFDGVGPDQRLKKIGYKYLQYGENIQYSTKQGVEAADFAINNWINSKPHRANLLDKDFTEVGIGMATNGAGRIYFTQDFGQPRK